MNALRNPLVRAGGLLLVLLVILALAAPLLTRCHVLRDPLQQDRAGLDRNGLPLATSRSYFLGTDNLGRDVLSRVVHGTRVSLTVGVAAVLTATLLGVTLGIFAGLYGRKADLCVMRFTDMAMAIPGILLAIELKRGMVSLLKRVRPNPCASHRSIPTPGRCSRRCR